MSIKITTDVFCDKCGNWIHGIVASRPRARTARRIAKADGWTRCSHGGKMVDLCPHCKALKVNDEN